MVAAAPALDVTVVAIGFLFLLIVGVMILRPVLVGVLSQAPFIGGWLSSNVDRGLAGVLAALTPAANAAFPVLINFITWLQFSWAALVGGAGRLGTEVFAALLRVVTLTLPHQIGLASAYLLGQIAAARTYAAGLVVAAQNAATAQFRAAEALSLHYYLAALTAAQGLFNEAQRQLSVAVQYLEGLIVRQSQADRAFTVREAQAVAAHAEQLFQQASAISAAADAALRNDLGAEAQALGRAIQLGVSSAEAKAAAEDAAVAGSAGLAIAAVAAAVRAVENSRCMKVCDELGALGEGLQALDLAAIFGVLAAVSHDPAGEGRALRAEVEPLAREIAGAVRGALAV